MNGMSITPAAIAAEILRQTAARGHDKSICPSEVARALGGGEHGPWRPLLQSVRDAAFALVRDGRIDVLRKGQPVVDAAAARGVIRLRSRP